MRSGREVLGKLSFGFLVLAFGTNLLASNIVCRGGKCMALVSKSNSSDKKEKNRMIDDIDRKNLFVSLDDNEVRNEEDISISSLKNIENSKNKIYACDDNHELVCSIEKNKDKETCECVS